MPINYDKLINWKIPEVHQQLTRRDTMLYALGVGLGADPVDIKQLRFVYEKELLALPTMAIVLGFPGPWFDHPETGVTRSKVVHGEQGFTVHRPLPVEGEIIGATRVRNILDKGAGKGALLQTECTVRDKLSNETICTLTSTTFCRADGGFCGPVDNTAVTYATPDTSPDKVCDLATLPQAALLYRLSGDYNPLHADPDYARKAGFKAPILHGRGTFGVVGHAILKTYCDFDPARFKSMQGRFSAPVYPGETIRTEMWRDGNVILFKAGVPARGVTILSNGRAEIIG